MEQVQPRAGVKIAAGVSAAVEPRARTYRNTNQLVALLSGLVGAAQYEVLSNQRGLAVISAGAQSTAQLVLIGLIVLGNLVYWFSRGRGKAK
jgi:tetrahydromethanopterin S-methyltransferase subunit D